jgi:hypothetical protein
VQSANVCYPQNLSEAYLNKMGSTIMKKILLGTVALLRWVWLPLHPLRISPHGLTKQLQLQFR